MVASSRAPSPQKLPGVVVAIVLLLGMVVIPTAGLSRSQADEVPFAVSAAEVDADAVLLAADIQPDGTAEWRVEYRVRLDDETTTEAFESLQSDVEANESAYGARFEDRMAPTVQDAAALTGRDMALRDVGVTTTTAQLPQTYGVLVYTFEWTNFAVVEGDQIRAGDALAGLFLDADSSLLLAWPEGYDVADVSPPPTEQRQRSVIWRGPVDFGPGEPDLVLAPAGGAGSIDTSVLGLGIVLVVLLGGGALWWWRHGTGHGGTDRPPGEAAHREGEPVPPDELLSNEERVLALLESHAGRMKQQAIVEQLGWTEAKTSQVVGKLREAGRIEGFRLGRENVLRLPDVDDPLTGEDRSAVDDQREA